jgi:hypothetical protein
MMMINSLIERQLENLLNQKRYEPFECLCNCGQIGAQGAKEASPLYKTFDHGFMTQPHKVLSTTFV